MSDISDYIEIYHLDVSAAELLSTFVTPVMRNFGNTDTLWLKLGMQVQKLIKPPPSPHDVHAHDRLKTKATKQMQNSKNNIFFNYFSIQMCHQHRKHNHIINL